MSRSQVRWLYKTFIFVIIGFLVWVLHCKLPYLISEAQSLGAYAFLAFIFLYCLAVLLFLPIEPVVLAAGALFGFYYGFVVNLFSAVLSAALAFTFSRNFGLSFIARSQRQSLNQWFTRFESLGWKSLALSRLTPFLPCALVNYGYGLTKMRFSVYLMTNIVFFIPYKLILSYAGSQL